MGKSGPAGLKRQVQNFNISTLDLERAEKTKELLKDVDLEEVQKLSDGAAVFYAWVRNTKFHHCSGKCYF